MIVDPRPRKATPRPGRITTILIVFIGCTIMSLSCQREHIYNSTASTLQVEALCFLDPAHLRNMNASHLELWVEETFEVSPTSYQQPDGSITYIWGEPDSGTIFGNAVVSEGYVKELRLETPSTYTFGDVVSSFGDPATISLYATRYEAALYTIELNYPQRGISLLTNEFLQPTSVITIRRDMTIKAIKCYPPGTEENSASRPMEWPGFDATIQSP